MAKSGIMSALLVTRPTLRGAAARLRPGSAQSRILNGSLVLLLGTGMVTLLNFGYNVAVARMLGPAAFGHAAAAVTLLMLVSAITLSFQLVCAKLVARNESPAARAAVFHDLLKRAWLVGVVLGSAVMLGSDAVAVYLNLPSRTEVILLALGIAFYVPLGAKRGGMQGVCAFRRLSWNFILEAVVKFAAALALVGAGFGVEGAVAAISISVVLAYFLPRVPSELNVRPQREHSVSVREGLQAVVFFIGQVVINNVDVLLVKHFFPPDTAGLYAAVALVGRVVYFASWSVVSAMFPVSAGTKSDDENTSMLAVPMLFVLGISVVFVVTLTFIPEIVLRTVFGPEFNTGSIGPLLSLYAAATGIYALSVVLITFEMSRRIANTGWLQLVFSGAIVVGIYLFHDSLREVVLVQLALMAVLLMLVSLPFLRRPRTALQEAS
ncbi:MAG: oligosaccharide flippase family protein [Candidatus Korobacteraceae bacterium]